MNENFKSGDVATTREGIGMVVTCHHERHARQPHWHYAVGGWDHLDCPNRARRLVVIDPEDREQVDRLARAYVAVHDYAGVPWDERKDSAREFVIDNLSAALREFATPTPPRPDEPTGAGAVVADRDGDWWVRLSRGADGAVWRRIGVPPARANYADIDVVRVLSEGVTNA